MAYRIKRTHRDHLLEVAYNAGISERLANDIVRAYIQDLKMSLQDGESITVPGLFTITQTRFADGHTELRGSVSSTIKKEVRGY